MWFPHVTVATVVSQNNTFLMVHEKPDGYFTINQPAGHLERDENLIQAAVRETKEETGWDVEVTHMLGVSLYEAPNGITYVRHSFAAQPVSFDTSVDLDDGIIEAQWMSHEEIIRQKAVLRSPLVLLDIERFLGGVNIPLSQVVTERYLAEDSRGQTLEPSKKPSYLSVNAV